MSAFIERPHVSVVKLIEVESLRRPRQSTFRPFGNGHNSPPINGYDRFSSGSDRGGGAVISRRIRTSGNSFAIDKRSYAIVNENNSIFSDKFIPLNVRKPVEDRLLPCSSSGNRCEYLVVILLRQKLPEIVEPTLDTDNNNPVHARSRLKLINYVTDYRFPSEFEELFWLISAAHARSNTACENYSIRFTHYHHHRQSQAQGGNEPHAYPQAALLSNPRTIWSNIHHNHGEQAKNDRRKEDIWVENRNLGESTHQNSTYHPKESSGI